MFNLEDKFDRYSLMFGPTPIERLARLSEHLGDRVDVYAKREDCNSGLAFGGNKIRKLEYLVPDATHWSQLMASSRITPARLRPQLPRSE